MLLDWPRVEQQVCLRTIMFDTLYTHVSYMSKRLEHHYKEDVLLLARHLQPYLLRKKELQLKRVKSLVYAFLRNIALNTISSDSDFDLQTDRILTSPDEMNDPPIPPTPAKPSSRSSFIRRDLHKNDDNNQSQAPQRNTRHSFYERKYESTTPLQIDTTHRHHNLLQYCYQEPYSTTCNEEIIVPDILPQFAPSTTPNLVNPHHSSYNPNVSSIPTATGNLNLLVQSATGNVTSSATLLDTTNSIPHSIAGYSKLGPRNPHLPPATHEEHEYFHPYSCSPRMSISISAAEKARPSTSIELNPMFANFATYSLPCDPISSHLHRKHSENNTNWQLPTPSMTPFTSGGYPHPPMISRIISPTTSIYGYASPRHPHVDSRPSSSENLFEETSSLSHPSLLRPFPQNEVTMTQDPKRIGPNVCVLCTAPHAHVIAVPCEHLYHGQCAVSLNGKTLGACVCGQMIRKFRSMQESMPIHANRWDDVFQNPQQKPSLPNESRNDAIASTWRHSNEICSETMPTSTLAFTEEMSGKSLKQDHRKLRTCAIEGCNRTIRSRGLCKAHGGGKRCDEPGCNLSDQGGGRCINHGGGKRCQINNCKNSAQSRGLCKHHGGGSRCTHPGCDKSSQGNGRCRAHGGGRRCRVEGCEKTDRRGGYCVTHGADRKCTVPECMKTARMRGLCTNHYFAEHPTTTNCMDHRTEM
uniref:Uncharacterized protein AlNc14C5G785 n=1 Tax=Albugo laibachii Nc14 TaxID=890382 RepID=F0W105_9STRA|nr:conserved hypothetical protein [Albugo laibachii Nc14]|eukprot:CCA14729.1 conserved hypothetical protein [Albugo laibachii Nc14]